MSSIINEIVYFNNFDILNNKKKREEYIKKIFENKCYKKVYIKKIKKIKIIDKNIIENNDFSLNYKCKIELLVDIIEIKKNDICELVITDMNSKLGIICKTDILFAYIMNSIELINKFKKNDKVKLKVIDTKYNKNSNRIVLITELLN